MRKLRSQRRSISDTLTAEISPTHRCRAPWPPLKSQSADGATSRPPPHEALDASSVSESSLGDRDELCHIFIEKDLFCISGSTYNRILTSASLCFSLDVHGNYIPSLLSSLLCSGNHPDPFSDTHSFLSLLLAVFPVEPSHGSSGDRARGAEVDPISTSL